MTAYELLSEMVDRICGPELDRIAAALPQTSPRCLMCEADETQAKLTKCSDCSDLYCANCEALHGCAGRW